MSRRYQAISTEWQLHQEAVRLLCDKWVSPNMDLFATHLIKRFLIYLSPVLDPGAWQVDTIIPMEEPISLRIFSLLDHASSDQQDQEQQESQADSSGSQVGETALGEGTKISRSRETSETSSVAQSTQLTTQGSCTRTPPCGTYMHGS